MRDIYIDVCTLDEPFLSRSNSLGTIRAGYLYNSLHYHREQLSQAGVYPLLDNLVTNANTQAEDIVCLLKDLFSPADHQLQPVGSAMSVGTLFCHLSASTHESLHLSTKTEDPGNKTMSPPFFTPEEPHDQTFPYQEALAMLDEVHVGPPPSFLPSLPPSLPPSLTLCLPPSLPPSYMPHSIPASLPLSLAPSLETMSFLCLAICEHPGHLIPPAFLPSPLPSQRSVMLDQDSCYFEKCDCDLIVLLRRAASLPRTAYLLLTLSRAKVPFGTIMNIHEHR